MHLNQDCFEIVCKWLDVKSMVALAATSRYCRQCVTQGTYCVFDEQVVLESPMPKWLSKRCLFSHTMIATDITPVRSISWSPNGRMIAFCSTYDFIHVWDVQDKILHKSKHAKRFLWSDLTWSPDSTHLAYQGDNGVVYVWEVSADHVEVWNTWSIPCRFSSVYWGVDGIQIACAMVDYSIVILPGKNITLSGHALGVQSLHWNPDGTQLVSVSRDRTVRIWCVQTGKCQAVWGEGAYDATWSPDGRTIMTVENGFRIRDRQNGQSPISKPIRSVWDRSMTCAYWSPDGRHVVSGSGDGAVVIWNVETGLPERILYQYISEVMCVAWSPDAKFIASSSHNTSLCLFMI